MEIWTKEEEPSGSPHPEPGQRVERIQSTHEAHSVPPALSPDQSGVVPQAQGDRY